MALQTKPALRRAIPNLRIKESESAGRQPARCEGQSAFNMGQHRLAYGRSRHGMHNIARPSARLDMAVAPITSRSTFGRPARRPPAVQCMLAEFASHALYRGPPDAAAHRLQGGKGPRPAGRKTRSRKSIWRTGVQPRGSTKKGPAIQLQTAHSLSARTPPLPHCTRRCSGAHCFRRSLLSAQMALGRNVITAFREQRPKRQTNVLGPRAGDTALDFCRWANATCAVPTHFFLRKWWTLGALPTYRPAELARHHVT